MVSDNNEKGGFTLSSIKQANLKRERNNIEGLRLLYIMAYKRLYKLILNYLIYIIILNRLNMQ
jgi:hypothetical protein